MNEKRGERPAGRVPQVAEFRRHCAAATGEELATPTALHCFSVRENETFWRLLLDWSDLSWTGSADPARAGEDVETAAFFPEVRLNYTENLLRTLPDAPDDAPALTAVHGDGSRERFTRGELRAAVRATATALARAGVAQGDRAVVIAPNNARAVVSGLAISALGATLATSMPDMGPVTLLGRLEQVEPAVLLLDRPETGGWDGEPGDSLTALLAGLPTVRLVVVLDDGAVPMVEGCRVERLTDLVAAVDVRSEPAPWPELPFAHPLVVLFSSGTTGNPKAMVHGAGGGLLATVKDHRLHLDLGPADTLYFHATTSWMLWNWEVAALASGTHVVCYDGPVRGPETLWELVADEGVTVLGTSPAYLQLCQDAGYRPAREVDLSALRTVVPAGAVLQDWQFDWFADAVGSAVLESMAGGTDIFGTFVLGHPELPVQRGRLTSLSLGMDVAALDAEGRPVTGEIGELVIRNPFPTRPLYFLRDPDGQRLHESYFAQNPGSWTQGDLIEIGADGSAVLHGRSDGVLNIDGVRIGPVEIYHVLRGMPQIRDTMAVEQRDPVVPGLSRLVLLVVLAPGVELDAELEAQIRTRLRAQASRAHVPAVVLAVSDLPTTHNGKKSERAARDVLNGAPVVNRGALKNPECLEQIAAAGELQRARATAALDQLRGADDVDDLVLRTWSALVGPPPSRSTSFFDVGGTSRQSMTLVRRLRLELGREVLMDAFLADPTVDGLVAAVRGAETTAQAPALVQLAPGTPGRTPFFFIHDAWGDVDVYRTAAMLMVDTGPVYGVRGELKTATGELYSLEQLAAAAVEEILRAAPDGPLQLGGHSFGGLVAFETARQLGEHGRTVTFLGLFDVLAPEAWLTPAQRRLQRWARQLAALTPGLRTNRLRDVVRHRLRPSTIPADDQVFSESSVAYDAYERKPYDGPLTYFRAEIRVPAAQNMMVSWREAVPQLRVVDVPGAHHHLFAERHVPVLARVLSGQLEAAGDTADRAA